MGNFIELVKRDISLAFRQGMDSLMVVAFFVIAVVLFPFGVGPEVNTLAKIAAGTIWVAALLSSMLSLERLFQLDYDDGSLELMALAPVPLEVTVLAKVVAHWLTTGVPLILTAPLLALLMQLPGDGFAALMTGLLLGTPTLSLIGAVGAALILGSRRGGVLLSLLVLPLYVPVLIFGVTAVDAALFDQAVRPHLVFLAGLLVAALALTPWAAAAGLRQALE